MTTLRYHFSTNLAQTDIMAVYASSLEEARRRVIYHLERLKKPIQFIKFLHTSTLPQQRFKRSYK